MASYQRSYTRTAFLKIILMFLFQSKMAAPSDPDDLFLRTADQSTTAAPTPPKPRQGYGPNEIVKEIFSYLDLRERARCASVCKQWHEIADDELAYRRLYRLDILDRKSVWEPEAYSCYPSTCCKSCHRALPFEKISDDMKWRRLRGLYVKSKPFPEFCISCQDLRDRDLAYLQRWRPDMPGRTIMWAEVPPKEGWKELYIHDIVLQFDIKHNREASSMDQLEAYANRPVIPYHEKNAEIEAYWMRKTNDDAREVLLILWGAKKWKIIPRLTLWAIAKWHKVSYHVEFELACRGWMRSGMRSGTPSRRAALMSYIDI